MKVSFTGSYLYTFNNRSNRNRVFEQAHEQKYEQKNGHSYDVFKINDTQMLVVNGQDYKDLNDILSLNQQIGPHTMKAYDRNIGAYVKKATEIDYTDLYKN